jgi:hypothetical protein
VVWKEAGTPPFPFLKIEKAIGPVGDQLPARVLGKKESTEVDFFNLGAFL